MAINWGEKPKSGIKWQDPPPEPVQRPTALPPALAEYAGGVNRSVAGMADFFTADPVNAISGLVGSDFRVPTFSQGLERATGGTHGFMEPGTARDVVQAAGEWTPAIATMRPKVPAKTGAKATQRLLDEAAPSIEALKAKSNTIYQQIDDLGATIDPKEVQKLSNKAFEHLMREGLDPQLHPKATQALKRVIALADDTPDIVGIKATDIDRMRKIASAAARDVDNVGKITPDGYMGKTLMGMLDDFIVDLPNEAIRGARPEKIKGLYTHARSLVHARKKAELIESKIELASTYASGPDRGLRQGFLALQRDIIKGKSKGWTPAEIEAIRKVSRGGRMENVYRLLGKMGYNQEGATRALIPLLGGSIAGTIGTALGGPVGGGVAVAGSLAAGNLFRTLATNAIAKNARLAAGVARAGKNGQQIANAYAKIVPKGLQNPAELSGLLLQNRVPMPVIEAMAKTDNVLIANGAFLASLATDLAE